MNDTQTRRQESPPKICDNDNCKKEIGQSPNQPYLALDGQVFCSEQCAMEVFRKK